MSIRPDEPQTQGAQLRRELDTLRQTQVTGQPIDASSEQVLTFDALNETEKSAASLGVDADAWRPLVRPKKRVVPRPKTQTVPFATHRRS